MFSHNIFVLAIPNTVPAVRSKLCLIEEVAEFILKFTAVSSDRFKNVNQQN